MVITRSCIELKLRRSAIPVAPKERYISSCEAAPYHYLQESAITMADTYSQIYIHVIFSVTGWQNLIKSKYKSELHKYIIGIIRNKNQKLMAINSMPDHIHILVSIDPQISISEFVRDIKSNSSRFINSKN